MATIRKRISADGTVRWQAIVRKHGQELYETFATRAKAESWGREQETLLERHRYSTPSEFAKAKLRPYLEEFIQIRGSRSLARWGTVLKQAAWVNKTVVTVAPVDITRWMDLRLRVVKPATVVRELNDISGFFTWLIKDRHVPITNPCHAVRRPSNADVARTKTYTWSEIRRLLKAAGYKRVPADYTGAAMLGHFFLLALRTAMRVGEIAKVCWSDIDLQQQYLHLPTTKNGDPRDVPLSSKAVLLLQRMYFGEEMLCPVGSETIGVYFRKARAEAGLGDVHFHDTRHHATTQMSEKLSVLELAAVTGHRDLKSLKRYYNPKASALAKKLG